MVLVDDANFTLPPSCGALKDLTLISCSSWLLAEHGRQLSGMQQEYGMIRFFHELFPPYLLCTKTRVLDFAESLLKMLQVLSQQPAKSLKHGWSLGCISSKPTSGHCMKIPRLGD